MRHTKIPTAPKRHIFRKGHLVQLLYTDWKHGPGEVVKTTGNGSVWIKWPRKGRRMLHNTHFLKRVGRKEKV